MINFETQIPNLYEVLLFNHWKISRLSGIIELRISNGNIWRSKFEPDARRDDEAVVNALRREETTPQQAKDRPTKFPLVIRSSISIRELIIYSVLGFRNYKFQPFICINTKILISSALHHFIIIHFLGNTRDKILGFSRSFILMPS